MYGYPINSESRDVGLQLSPSSDFIKHAAKNNSLIIDFDSRYGVLKSGNSVISWTDKAKGITATAPSISMRPEYTVSAYNNIPAILFNGTGLSFEGSIQDIEGMNDFTIIMVCLGSNLGSNSCSNGSFFYQVKDEYTDYSFGVYADNGVNTQLILRVHVANGSGIREARVDNSLGLSSLNIYAWTYDGKVPTGTNTFKHSIYGAPRTANQGFTAGIPRRTFTSSGRKTQFNLGCFTNGSGFNTTSRDGHLVRVQVYNTEIPITSLEYKGIISDLMNEYNLIYKREVICVGDSRTHNSNHDTTDGWVRQAQLSVGESAWLLINAGLGFDTISNALAEQSNKLINQLNTFKKQIICVWYGRNDLNAGTSAATVYSNLNTYCQNIKTSRPDALVILFTELPSSSSNPNYETDRQTLNTSIRTEGSPTWDYIADIGNDGSIGQAGQNTDTTYYASDAIHPNYAGDTIIASYVISILANL